MAVVVGVAVLTTSPGVQHPYEARVSGLQTREECLQVANGLARAIRDTMGGSVRSLRASCRPVGTGSR